jgi:RNA polymerase sigma-70 factor (ECF subfamily)
MLASTIDAVMEEVLAGERARLVRLCAKITGDHAAAEDLAQETLLEAWRHAHKLHDPQGYAPWLSAIARNVCFRWRQRRGRDLAYRMQPSSGQTLDVCDLIEAQADDFDLEVELERDELAKLLDRALALLPADTRTALIERYVEETPIAEIAVRLGVTDSGLKARLRRGRLTLRRVLLTDFPDEAAAYGLAKPEDEAGQETRIWCSECGRAKLIGHFDRSRGELSLGCPHCAPGPTGYSWLRAPAVFHGVKGYRAALSRQAAWVHDYCGQALQAHMAACVYCDCPATLHMGPPAEGLPHLQELPGVFVRCQACHAPVWSALGSLALSFEGRRFWQRRPRIHALPPRPIEVAGSPAIVVSYRSVADAAQLDVVFVRDTLEVIGIHGAPDSERS